MGYFGAKRQLGSEAHARQLKSVGWPWWVVVHEYSLSKALSRRSRNRKQK